MRTHELSLLLGVLLLLNACAALPTGPRVLILPGAGKPLEVFQRDDGECQAYASHSSPLGHRRVRARQRRCNGAMIWPIRNVCMPKAIGCPAMPYHLRHRRLSRLRQAPHGPELIRSAAVRRGVRTF